MKNKIKIASGILAFSFALTAAASCGGVSGGESDSMNNSESTYHGYDESKRVEDTRTITDREYTVLNVVGTDDYGRKIVTVDGKKDNEKYVGMFFFLTLGQHANHKGIYDISKITQDGLDLDAFQSNSQASPVGAAHFWGEPVFGYYNSTDEWVIRKQIEMLTLAGIDFIVLDTSNAVLYKQVTDVLFPVMLEYKNAGWNVPKVMYYLASNDNDNTVYPESLRTVYNYFYATDTYKDLWFCPNGKPLITRHELASDEFLKTFDGGKYLDFFEFKTRQWPINDYNKDDGASWMEFEYPQPIHGDWISISVAQHYSVRFSDTVGTHGRGFDETTGQNDHENYGKGLNYQTQWETAYSYDSLGINVKYAFITGWNEWVAEKMRDSSGVYFTVDQFNEEYSRDIEPCVNEKVADNFYMQTIRNIKAFNYSEAKHYVYPKTTVDMTHDGDEWKDIRAYVDFTNDCKDRDSFGMVKTLRYTDNSGRNDIETVKVARDDEYLYFRVTTKDDITSYTDGDEKWMNILLKTDNGTSLWNGYNYVLNRSVSGDKTAIMKASKNGKSLEKCGEGEVKVYGRTMLVKVALKDLGLSSDNYHIEFKVADNVAAYDHVELYRSGDVAPIGRLNYSYGY